MNGFMGLNSGNDQDANTGLYSVKLNIPYTDLKLKIDKLDKRSTYKKENYKNPDSSVS
jgi:hypothetical protein